MPAITLVVAVPPFVSQEEYNTLIASTPNSFNDLPAVLKHKEDDVSVKIDPSLQGFSEEDAAKGTLYLLTRHVHPLEHSGMQFLTPNSRTDTLSSLQLPVVISRSNILQ